MLTHSHKQARLCHITGSDVSAVLGVSPWCTAQDVWREKMGLFIESETETKAMMAGSFLEPSCLNWFSAETGKKVIQPTWKLLHKEQPSYVNRAQKIIKVPPKLLVHPIYPPLAASLDGFIVDEHAVVEAKTAQHTAGWGGVGENIIPQHYLCQIAFYCEVTGAEKAYVVVLFRGIEFRIYEYHKSEKFQQLIVEKMLDFWNNNVLKEVAPPPHNYADVITRYTQLTDEAIIATEEIIDVSKKYKEVQKEIKELDKQAKKMRDEIACFMKDSQYLVDQDNNKILDFKSYTSSRFDSKKLKNEHPDLYEKYLTESAMIRKLNIK